MGKRARCRIADGCVLFAGHDGRCNVSRSSVTKHEEQQRRDDDGLRTVEPSDGTRKARFG